jgi:hypothetical protein
MSNFKINDTTNLTQIFYSLSSSGATAQTLETGFKYNDGGTEKDLITLFAKYVQGALAPTTNYISTAYGNADLNTIFQNISVSPVLYSVSNDPNITCTLDTNNGFTGLIFNLNSGNSGNATFTLNRNYNMTIIVVAGGGGGGGGNGGGGGGGGTIYLSDSFTAGSYQIQVGGGGTAGGTAINGGGGNTSSFNSPKYLTSGGGGGLTRGNNGNGGNGGSTSTVVPPPPVMNYSFGGGGGGGGGYVNGITTSLGGLGGALAGDPGQGMQGSIIGTTYAGNGGNSYNYNYPAPPGGINLPFLNTPTTIQVGGGGAGGGISNGSTISGGCGLGQGGTFPFVSNTGQSSISNTTNGYGNGGGGGVGNGGAGGDGVVIIYWSTPT